MKASVLTSRPRRTLRLRDVRWQLLTDPIRHVPQRIREPRFWHIQALVAIATVPHYLIESLGYTNPAGNEHGLAITLYILPLLYAALSFGWEGAILTALWAAFLTSPSTWIWHRSGLHWFTELGQLMVTLPVGILVAWRVDLEAKQRRRAEETSASLRLLNDIGEILSHTLEVEQQIPHVLRRVLSGLSLESVWLCLEPESPGSGLLTMAEVAHSQAPSPTVLVQDLHRRLKANPELAILDSRTVAVPLSGEAGIIGSLGATAAKGQLFSGEEVELLTTIAQQVRAAVDNARLYRQRQESLRSYAHQVTQAQEEERLRIARELHDETAQEMVRMVRKLERLRDSAAASQAPSIDEILDLTRNTLEAVRRYSHDLRPPVLDDLGLVAAIEMVVEDMKSSLPGGSKFGVRGSPRRLGPTVELALFRIVQEALRNVEKHADAASATIELDFDEDNVRVSVADDGRGFSPPKEVSDLSRAGKLGLVGMKERAELVGGRFELSSSTGRGTQIVVKVASMNKPLA